MTFLALKWFPKSCLQMGLMSADTAARGQGITAHVPGRGPQRDITFGGVERTVACIARFRPIRLSVAGKAGCLRGAAGIISAMARFTERHVPV